MNDSGYSKLSTAELIERIALHSDGEALNELLSCRKLVWIGKNGVRLLLSDFLWELKQKRFWPFLRIGARERAAEEKLDLVYSFTLQKFSVLRLQAKTADMKGPYCDTRYTRLHEEIKSRIKPQMHAQLDEETEVARIFRNLVLVEIYFSGLEAYRETERAFERYPWQVPGMKPIQLKRPSSIEAREFKKWLEQNIDFNHLEKEIIQEQIYKRFGFGKHFDFDEIQEYDTVLAVNPDPGKDEERAHLETLYEKVADEKSESFQEQRPAIRKLGREKVRQLVLRILDGYVEQGSKDIDIAKEFNLSKATFSRFAGRDWQKSKDGSAMVVPDLWLNMAKMIHRDPYFSEAAIRLGIKEMVDAIQQESEKA